jgi:RNA-directed DNA polymerase
LQEGGCVKDTAQESRPAEVAGIRSKQAGEIRTRWAWVEPVVWTDRMLAALEQGVQGGVWFSLIDKVTSLRGLRAAWDQVRRNRGSGGVDRETIDQFGCEAETRLSKLSEQLKDGTYRPLPVRRVYIPKPDGRKRPLGIPAIRDRIVQAALRNVMEPIFEREFCEHSYGFRPGRGAKDALRRVDGQLKAGYRYVVDADLKSYFDTIPHERLLSLVRRRVADGRVLALVEAFLNQSVLEEMQEWRPTEGTPQGGVISPLLANIYLHPLDTLMHDQGFEMTRYADDFVVLCRTAEECGRALEMIRAWVTEVGLTLHPEKTRVVNMNEPGGFDFLGYHFERDYRTPRSKSVEKLKETIRTKTRRTNGRSLSVIITDLNRTLRGWFAFFKHSRYWVFKPLDRWIRVRLRSILRKRAGKRGLGRGSDNQRWPNAYFAEMGLFSMLTAYREASRPHRAH